MSTRESLFFQRSKEIAENFLQSTVIIDDEAFFGEDISASSTASNNPDNDKASIKSESQSEKNIVARGVTKLEPPVVESEASHRLNAQSIINSFAQKGIICSVIKPTPGFDLATTVRNLASSADIIVIDWELNNDNGGQALDILEQISQSAIARPAQLRLFAIYTGDPSITEIAANVKKTLEKKLDIAPKIEDDGFTLSFRSVRIVVFAKPGTGIPEQYNDRKVDFENLADRVTSEFAMMTAGLVSNVAVKAFAQIRENTFGILGRFAQELDAPYLTHRLLQPTPQDAEDHIVSLIAAEFHAILEEAGIGSKAGIEAIEEWLTLRGIKSFKPAKNSKDNNKNRVEYDQSALSDLLRRGATKLEEDLGKYPVKSVYKSTTEQLLSEGQSGVGLDDKFAMLSESRNPSD